MAVCHVDVSPGASGDSAESQLCPRHFAEAQFDSTPPRGAWSSSRDRGPNRSRTPHVPTSHMRFRSSVATSHVRQLPTQPTDCWRSRPPPDAPQSRHPTGIQAATSPENGGRIDEHYDREKLAALLPDCNPFILAHRSDSRRRGLFSDTVADLVPVQFSSGFAA